MRSLSLFPPNKSEQSISSVNIISSTVIRYVRYYRMDSELPLPCGTVVPMEVASNSRDSYPFLTKRLAVRTNQGIFTYAAIPLTGIPFGFSLWNPYTSGAERNV